MYQGFIAFILFIGIPGLQTSGRYPVKKIYAYQQQVKSGVSGNRESIAESKNRHLIYLQLWSGRSVEVTGVWVNGTATGFRTETVTAPVIQNSKQLPGKQSNITLVRPTEDPLLQIFTENPIVEGSTYPRWLKKYPLLIAYTAGNRTYYLGATMRTLAPQIRQ